MELRDILSRRRMHRAFLPDPIPEDQCGSSMSWSAFPKTSSPSASR
jgi:hypothetical protein